MAINIAPDDLTVFNPNIPEDRAEAMIERAIARACSPTLAPCLAADDLDPEKAEAAKSIIIDAILRWADRGSGAITTENETAGVYSRSRTVDTSQGASRTLFYPSEIDELKQLCGRTTASEPRASMPDRAPAYPDPAWPGRRPRIHYQ